MPLFGRKKERAAASPLGVWIINSDSQLPRGYHRLLDSPEISACINRMAAIISSATIYLMENSRRGDVRVRDDLARFVDVDPWPGMATRQSWMNWIVTQLLGDGDGEAFVLPRTSGGKFTALEPMPGAVSIENPSGAISYSGAAINTSPTKFCTSGFTRIPINRGRAAAFGFRRCSWPTASRRQHSSRICSIPRITSHR